MGNNDKIKLKEYIFAKFSDEKDFIELKEINIKEQGAMTFLEMVKK